MQNGAILLMTMAPVGYIEIAKNELSINQGFRYLIRENGNIFRIVKIVHNWQKGEGYNRYKRILQKTKQHKK